MLSKGLAQAAPLLRAFRNCKKGFKDTKIPQFSVTLHSSNGPCLTWAALQEISATQGWPCSALSGRGAALAPGTAHTQHRKHTGNAGELSFLHREGHGLVVGLAVLGEQSDPMILEVFSNLNESVIKNPKLSSLLAFENKTLGCLHDYWAALFYTYIYIHIHIYTKIHIIYKSHLDILRYKMFSPNICV